MDSGLLFLKCMSWNNFGLLDRWRRLSRSVGCSRWATRSPLTLRNWCQTCLRHHWSGVPRRSLLKRRKKEHVERSIQCMELNRWSAAHVKGSPGRKSIIVDAIYLRFLLIIT